ncbi:MAG: LPXTG cell wall anchor domain-containing protein [Streptococcaceae bacterium]|jgi:LPXTG-motif cell wall-anchored protein|nr:LPXTG cell wall anchor domain-containing protein [Streptococcaceae bacterium]
MNFKKKLFSIVATGMLLAPSVVSTIQPFTINAETDAEAKYEANAETSTHPVIVNLHKVKVTQTEFDEQPYQNTGDLIAALEEKEKIAGVVFRLYDVTPFFDAELKRIALVTNVLETTQEQRLQAFNSTVDHYKGKTPASMTSDPNATLIDTKTTGSSDGIAKFENVAQASGNGANKVYVAVESNTSGAYIVGTPSTNIVQIPKTVNTVFSLPVLKDQNSDDLYLASETDNVVDLYPKNVVDSRPDIEKKLVSTQQDKADDSDGDLDGFVFIDDKDATNGPLGTTGNTSDPTVTRSIGELVEFEINYKLPYDLSSLVDASTYKHAYFKLNDLPDDGLAFFSIDKITIEDQSNEHTDFADAKTSAQASYNSLLSTPLNLTINKYSNEAATSGTTDYNKTKNLQFNFVMPTTVSQTNTEKLQKLAGKVITIKLRMIVTQDAPIEKSMNNLIRYKNHKNDGSGDNEGQDDSEFVIVFKKGFDKVNGRSSQLITDGKAAFVLKRNDGKYFGGYTTDGEVRWLNVTGDHKASDFAAGEVTGSGTTESGDTFSNVPVQVFWTTTDSTNGSASTGKINLPGLRKGTYQVEEVQSPDGYYLDDSATTISFTIDGSLNQSTYVGQAGKTLEKIKNYPKGYLPSTGGIGIVIFLVIGISAMGIGGYMLVRNRKIKGNIS